MKRYFGKLIQSCFSTFHGIIVILALLLVFPVSAVLAGPIVETEDNNLWSLLPESSATVDPDVVYSINLKEPRPLIIDLRMQLDYYAGSVPRAKNIPYKRMMSLIKSKYRLPKDKPIIVYHQGNNWKTADVRKKLKERGLNAWVMDGGYSAWIEGGAREIDRHPFGPILFWVPFVLVGIVTLSFISIMAFTKMKRSNPGPTFWTIYFSSAGLMMFWSFFLVSELIRFVVLGAIIGLFLMMFAGGKQEMPEDGVLVPVSDTGKEVKAKGEIHPVINTALGFVMLFAYIFWGVAVIYYTFFV